MGQSSCKQVDKVRLCEDHTTVDLLLAKKYGSENDKKQYKKRVVNTRVICRPPGTGSHRGKCETGQVVKTTNKVKGVKVLNKSVNMCHSIETSDNPPGLDVDFMENNTNFSHVTFEKVESSEIDVELNVSDSSVRTNVETKGGMSDSFIPLYDINFVGIEDKFCVINHVFPQKSCRICQSAHLSPPGILYCEE